MEAIRIKIASIVKFLLLIKESDSNIICAKLGSNMSETVDPVHANFFSSKNYRQREELHKAFRYFQVLDDWQTTALGIDLIKDEYRTTVDDIIDELVVYGELITNPECATQVFGIGHPMHQMLNIRNAAFGLDKALKGAGVEAQFYPGFEKMNVWISVIDEIIASVPHGDIRSPLGARPQVKEQYIAYSLAKYYYALTGVRPNRSAKEGSYLALLQDTFRILGLKVNAERQARTAISRLSGVWA